MAHLRFLFILVLKFFVHQRNKLGFQKQIGISPNYLNINLYTNLKPQQPV
jgi:hypothetical protein